MKHRPNLLLAVTAVIVVVGSATLWAQDATTAAKPAVSAEPAVHSRTLMDRFKEGGFIMWPILGCSIATLYFIVEGSLRTSQKRMIPPAHLQALQTTFRQGDYVGAYNFTKANKSPITNVCRAAISMLGEGKTAVEEATIQELQKESSHLTFYISYLSVIGVCAPMIGLLGTVSGMIAAFDTLGTSGIGDPSKLASAIGEVLVATFSGLFVAIPAFIAFYYLRNRAAKAIHDVQDAMNSLFRKMPYDQLAGAHIGSEELYANTPNWVTGNEAVAAEINA
jgi:biopolymer transport protein ExbB